MRENSDSNFMVDVPMCAYNHENFIGQAIEGIINQKTNFRFRLLIGEDCSTDGTRAIVKSYLDRYPERIEVIFHEKNVGAFQNSRILFKECHAKYIALCDGDDYWANPDKLQRQVDFLEKNQDFVACFHNVKVLSAESDNELVYSDSRKTEIDLHDLAEGDYMHTCSLLFKNLPGFFTPFLKNLVPMDDDSIGYCLLLEGRKARYINEVMAVYRRHNGGMWSSLSNEQKLLWTIEHRIASIKYYKDDILSPILRKRLKSETYTLIKISIKSFRFGLFLKYVKIYFQQKFFVGNI